VVRRIYIPDAGDLVWLDFSPQAGREQAGRRPAVILSPATYNERAGLAVACPVTSHAKNYPFEVALPPGGAVTGVVLADHLKSVDWRQRRAESAGRVPEQVMGEVRDRIAVMLRIG
jgi:mRNA interferase MazF